MCNNAIIKCFILLFLSYGLTSIGQNLNCGVPSWYDDIAYSDPGGTDKTYAYVEYNGKVYRNNKYIGKNETAPDSHTGWDEIGSCSDLSMLPLADNCAKGENWDASKSNYNTGDLVVYQEGLYQAKYWISGSAVPDKYGAYNFLGVCVTRPLITTTFSGNIERLQPSLQAIQISAQVDDYGFTPIAVKFMIKELGTANFSEFTMTSLGTHYEYQCLLKFGCIPINACICSSTYF